MDKGEIKMKVFLGGTCANSKWREKIIPQLQIKYFNPVVKRWTEECKKEELRQRETCDFLLYTITRAYSIYSIAEVVDDSNKRPDKTVLCVINEMVNGREAINKQEMGRLDEIGRMVQRNGGKYFKNMNDVVKYLNDNGEN